MADVLAYHPGTGATALVDQQALDHHLRSSGWMTRDEWDELAAAQEARAAEQAGAAAPEGTTGNEGE